MSDWIRLRDRKPDKDAGRVLVWHRFNGVMMACAGDMGRNRFITHWMPVPETGWINTAEDRMPDESDGDAQQCVLALGANGVTVTVWHRVTSEWRYLAWMPTPEGPAEREAHGEADF